MKKFLVALSVSCIACMATAQNFTGGFNFAFPYKDSLPAAFLPSFNTSPLTAADQVSAVGKHFIVRNQPYAFWGVNIVAAGAFPDKADASGIAAHAAKMGINLVRFHHLDNPSWTAEGSLFVGGQSTRTLNPTSLDKLDYFIYQLKQHGIYTNMNLNVSRTFNNLDGVPGADSLREFGKGVTIFDPQLGALQKEFARQLLLHTNPYTGSPLANDPALAMLEMINENSLYGMWKDDALQPQSRPGGYLTWRHSRMLDSMWNEFLVREYGTQQALQQAWNTGGGSSTQLITDGGFEGNTLNANWQNELHNGAAASFTQDASVARSGSKSARINITSSTGTDWHVQFKHVGFSLQKDTSYKVTFWARAAAPMTVPVALMRNGAPYTWFGGASFNLTSTWQQFSMTVVPTENVVNDGRLSFNLGAGAGSVWIDDVSLQQPQRVAFNAGELLSSKNIQRSLYSQRTEFANQRMKDLSKFYNQLQKNFMEELRQYLRDSVGVVAPITGNNAFTGIQEGWQNENLDYYDDHAYWDHPNFPGAAWDPANWIIANTPMVRQQDFSAIASAFSGIPLHNKPITVSEYNHAAPNRYRVEMVPAIAAYGAFQGMDGLMFFDYNSDVPSSWSGDVCNNFFSIHRDHSVMSLFPAAAYAYRNHYISEGAPFLVNYSADDIFNSYKQDASGRWGKYTPYDKRIQLSQVVQAGSYRDASGYSGQTLPIAQSGVHTTSTGETQLNTNNGLLTTATPRYISLAGFLNTAVNQSVGALKLVSAADFGAITWVSLNNKQLATGDSSFMAIAARQQNTGMVWSSGNTTVRSNWGSSPTSQYPLSLQMRVSLTGSCLLLHTLNAQGQRTGTKSIIANAGGGFDISVNQSTDRTLWYGLEVLGSNVIEWSGAVSRDWFNAANWCCGQVPGPQSRVVINNGKPNYPLLNGNTTIWSLRVGKGAVLDVQPGVVLTAQGQ